MPYHCQFFCIDKTVALTLKKQAAAEDKNTFEQIIELCILLRMKIVPVFLLWIL